MGDKHPNFASTSGLVGTTRAPTMIGNEEPAIVQSRDLKTILWGGVKYVYSGAQTSGASGFCYYSGECDVEPPSGSGWGRIRIPELGAIHHAIIVPRMPFKANIDYIASGVGGCSGNVMMVHWQDLTQLDSQSGMSGLGTSLSGFTYWNSGLIVSGMVDIIAIGSK